MASLDDKLKNNIHYTLGKIQGSVRCALELNILSDRDALIQIHDTIAEYNRVRAEEMKQLKEKVFGLNDAAPREGTAGMPEDGDTKI